ncbi:gliding motility lipoprotein GldD [Mucilaginibacter puniceus]
MGDMELKGSEPMRVFAVIVVAILFLAACGGGGDYSPKPRGYFRIELPNKEYRPYQSAYPFTFEYPVYAQVEQDSTPARTTLQKMQYKLNMQFKQFNGTLHLSYQPITSKKIFDELIEDAHKLAFKHTVKATGIDEARINFPERKVYGLYYTIDGNAASAVQFYLTDSVRHYLRGALYFNESPQFDSIQPVLNFVKKDVDVLIKTLRWK